MTTYGSVLGQYIKALFDFISHDTIYLLVGPASVTCIRLEVDEKMKNLLPVQQVSRVHLVHVERCEVLGACFKLQCTFVFLAFILSIEVAMPGFPLVIVFVF